MVDQLTGIAAGVTTHRHMRQAAQSLSADALDFAPDLLAVQERPPERLPRVLLMCVVALVLILLAWASLARLDIVASAEGRLVPEGFTKVVQPWEAGAVGDILVKDGDTVVEGQVLLKMDARLSDADRHAWGTDVSLRKLTLQRIDAELTGQSIQPVGSDQSDLLVQIDHQFLARRRAHLDAMAQEAEALNRARAELEAAQQVMLKLAQTLPLYKTSAEAYRQLLTEGFVGRLAAAEKSREFIEKEQDLKTQSATVSGLRSAISQLEKRTVALRSQYRSQLEDLRIDTVTQLNRSALEFEKSTVKAGMLEVRSPANGVVKDLAVATRGAVVPAGTVLMHVVPVEDSLQAEILLKNEDVGFVDVGQAVRVKVAAYPFQKHGLLDGAVSLISADASDPGQTPDGQGLQMTYRALVHLSTTHLPSPSTREPLPLSPGMRVVAEIHLGRRSVLEYLLSPVKKVTQEAARER